jgi:hypothetical protein
MDALTKEEIAELEKAYARNRSFVWQSGLAMLGLEIMMQLIDWIKGKPAFHDFFLLKVMFGIWLIIAGFLLLFILPKIKKDLAEQGKITFRTRILRKGHSNELDAKTWGMRVEKNNYGIKFVKLSREAYLAVEPHTFIELSVSPHAHVYLSHRELS